MHIRRTIQHDHAELDACLRTATNGRICVDTYKALRFAYQAVAIGTIVLTAVVPEMTLSPTAYIVLGALALGPNVAEAYLTR